MKEKDVTQEFFEGLARGHEPALEKATGKLRFDLREGKRTTRWMVGIRKGDITVSHESGDADCVFRTDRSLFDGMVRGEVNTMAAVLRGAAAFEGDPGLIVLFQRLFPGPAGSADQPGRVASTGRQS